MVHLAYYERWTFTRQLSPILSLSPLLATHLQSLQWLLRLLQLILGVMVVTVVQLLL